MVEIPAKVLENIAGILHKKYLQMIKIHDLTVQMQEAVSRNDNVSIQLYMDMRQDVMIAVDGLEGEMEQILNTISHEGRERMAMLMNKEAEELPNVEEGEEKIVKAYANIQRQLQKTIALDKELNKKITGTKSFYQNNGSL